MKWLIILGLLAILAIFIAVKFRRHIQSGIYIFKMFRQMRRMSRQADGREKQIDNAGGTSDVQLVRCTKCASWIPQNTALKLSKNTFYCSSKCLEQTIEVR